MAPRPLPIFIDALNVHANPMQWSEVSRFEAIRMADQERLVVATMAQSGIATRFDDQSPFWRADGPYDYSSLRYFLFHSGSNNFAVRPAGTGRIVKKQAPVAEAPESELVPLEKSEEESVPVRAAASPPAAAKPQDPIQKELRFDLALDPSTPGLEDDVFVLSSGDGTYNMSKSVKDDKVPGDKKLTLVFPGVTEGKSYSLSQVHDGEETILVPEVSYGASKAENGPGEIVGCKVVFRECRIKGEKEDFYKEKESDYLIELVPASGKWVYVFGGPRGKPYRLLAEGVGLSDGSFRPVDVVKQAGKNERSPMKRSSGWMTLPLLVNGKAWELYACLSPFQLPWKRVQQLAANPKPRCYKVGAKEGAVMWAPKNVGRDVPDLLGIRDPRVKDPGKDTLLLGLVDAMAEAKRRSDIYRKHVEPYLEYRFDIPPIGGKPVSPAERRKKYLAGMVKAIVEKHPEGKRLRTALAGNGTILDSYLVEVNEREIALKQKAEKTGAALVKWMDHPSGIFEATLCDYASDSEIPELWQEAKDDFAYLIRYFDATALTRLYSRRIFNRKDAWIHTYILTENSHQAARKLTDAAVEILTWLGNILVREETFELKILEQYYRRFVPGIELEFRSLRTMKERSLVAELFPDEKQKARKPKGTKYWEILESTDYSHEIQVIWLVEHKNPSEKLRKVADSKIAKTLVLGLESMNISFALRKAIEERSRDSAFGVIGSAADAFSSVIETLGLASTRFKNRYLPIIGLVGASVDVYLAYRQSQQDAKEKDYDAAAAQILLGAGSVSSALGAALSVGSGLGFLTSSAGAATSLTASGAGLSATGIGAPVGVILLMAGVITLAAGSVAFAWLKDGELEAWIKTSPFGLNPKWDFANEAVASVKAGELSARFYPWKSNMVHSFITGPGEYRLSIQGPFSPYTKVTVHAFDLIDKDHQSTRFLQDEILKPTEAKSIRVYMALEEPISLTLAVKDSACWAAHRTRFPKAENGFKYCRVELTVDQHGDGEIVWKPGKEGKPVLFDIGRS